MKINLIVATDKKGNIGFENKIPWHSKQELALFKQTTLNHPIVMGRKTAESIGRALPQRINYIVSRTLEKAPFDGQLILKDPFDLFSKEHEEVFIIGGAEIYKFYFNHADKIFLSVMDLDCDKADTVFPYYNNLLDHFKLDQEKKFESMFANDISFTRFIYDRLIVH